MGIGGATGKELGGGGRVDRRGDGRGDDCVTIDLLSSSLGDPGDKGGAETAGAAFRIGTLVGPVLITGVGTLSEGITLLTCTCCAFPGDHILSAMSPG